MGSVLGSSPLTGQPYPDKPYPVAAWRPVGMSGYCPELLRGLHSAHPHRARARGCRIARDRARPCHVACGLARLRPGQAGGVGPAREHAAAAARVLARGARR